MQGELFNLGVSGKVAPEASKFSQPPTNWLDRFRVTLRLDHLSIAAIFALVLYVLVFSFGVEKGKRMALRELEAQKIKQVEVAKELSQTDALALKPPVLSPVLAKPTVSGPVIGRFTIQVITFSSKDRARAEQAVQKLKEKGYQSFTITGKKTLQVCVETFEDAGIAREKLTQLKSDGFVPNDAYIRPLKGPVSAI